MSTADRIAQSLGPVRAVARNIDSAVHLAYRRIAADHAAGRYGSVSLDDVLKLAAGMIADEVMAMLSEAHRAAATTHGITSK